MPAALERAADPVTEATTWLANTPRAQRGSAIPELRHRFRLSLEEAIAVVRENNLRLARAS